MSLPPGPVRSQPRRIAAWRWSATVAASVLAAVAGIAVPASAPAHAEAARPAAAGHAAPRIFPAPQEESTAGVEFSLSGTVPVVVGPHSDGAARASLAAIVRDAGGHAQFTTTTPPGRDAVYLGTDSDSPALARALRSLRVKGASQLAPEGYVIASGVVSGHKALILDGRDAAGTYYATQSLRQAVSDGSVPPLRVRDWPLIATRGVIEGFYGIPWTQQATLDQLAFYGTHKLNTFVYSPKDDPMIRDEWRTPYSAAQLASMKLLVASATAHHVDFGYGLDPAGDICYSSDQDFEETIAKLDQVRAVGVTSFQIGLDDIPMTLNCDQDVQRFGSADDEASVAAAQSFFLNRIVSDFIEPNGLAPLKFVPTDFAGTAGNPYREAIGVDLDASVGIEWTGEGIISDTVAADSARQAAASYSAEHLYLWDNFPVNDGQTDRLFLNPLSGRAADLGTAVEGILSNPMSQPYASMIAAAEYGDYAWNGPAYSPETSQRAAIDELAGSDSQVRAALAAFVDLNQNWAPYRADSQNAPALGADIERFWTGYRDNDIAAMQPLRDRLAILASLPTTLSHMAQHGFAADTAPWTAAAAHWANALQQEITAMLAVRHHDAGAATDAVLAALADQDATTRPAIAELSDGHIARDAIVPSVGDGQFAQFSERAMHSYDTWLGLSTAAYPAQAASDWPAYDGHAPSDMVDGDLETEFWSYQEPAAGEGVTLDLGSIRPVGSIQIHQSSADTVLGDMVYHAELQYSADGQDWQDAGTFDSSPVIQAQFPTPVSARYVRLIAVAPNPDHQWVEIRGFAVSGPLSQLSSTLPARSGHPASAAFDTAVATSFATAAKPGAHSNLTRTLPEPQRAGAIIVIARATGMVQVRDAHGWRTLGSIQAGDSFAQFPLHASITGMRIVFTPGSVAPVVNELGLRTAPLDLRAVPFFSAWWPWLIAAAAALGVGVLVVWRRSRWKRSRRDARRHSASRAGW